MKGLQVIEELLNRVFKLCSSTNEEVLQEVSLEKCANI